MDLNNNIKLTDEDLEGKLKNYCYEHCNNESSLEVKNCRGLVYRDEKPFLKSFGYTPTYTIDTLPKDINFENCRFFESFEGTLLRLFYNDINDRWYLSTHRKLDASNSFWGSQETFGSRFNNIIKKEDYNKLNKEYYYMFLITPNKNNRIVCTENLNRIVHVGTYDKNFNLSYDYDVSISRPNEFIFNNFEEFKNTVESIDIKSLQGIVISNVKTQTNIKVLNKNYKNLSDIRGNTASIKFRYLELRRNKEKKNLLYTLYPDNIINFEEYERILSNITNNILKSYINRYIKHIYTSVSPEEYVIQKKCHEWHKQDKEKNKITRNKVIEILNQQTPVHLNRLIKNYKQNNNKDKDNDNK